MRGNLKVLSVRSMETYREAVVARLRQYPRYAECCAERDIEACLGVSRFADGEMEVEIDSSVRGCDVFLFAGASRNSLGLPVDENKIETYHAIDALRRAQAGRITLFEPYCSPARSDRPTRRNSVGLWVHLKILVSLGIDHYITFQLHSEKSKSFIDPTSCAVDDIPAHSLLARFLCDTHIHTLSSLDAEVRTRWMFCSVDAGGETLAKRFAAAFGAKMVISHKQRDYSTRNRVEAINILASEPLEGKVLWIIDDMIDTGDSVSKLAAALAARKPAEMHIAAVHPVFSPPAVERLERLCADKLVRSILVTDTVPCPPEILKQLPCLRVVPSVDLAADIIHRLNGELPLSPLIAAFDAPAYLQRA